MRATDHNGEITEAIEQLRAQLTAAQEGSAQAKLRFTVTEIEMEFLVQVTKEGGSSAGLRLGLVSAGADGKISRDTSHRLKLKLDVRDTESGELPAISDRR